MLYLEEKHEPRGGRRIARVYPQETRGRDTKPVSIELIHEMQDGMTGGSEA
jgi:hypothetical protein